MRALLTIILFSLMSLMLLAQAPQKMSYQAVVRNNAGELIRNQPVGIRTSILQGDIEGVEVFKEIYNPNPETNSNGLVTFEIGAGIAVVGSFQVIDWASGPYFVKTEVDPTGGTNYSIVGTNQLLSVPYALHAKTAESISQPMEETDPIFTQSPAATIKNEDIGNWNETHGWGDHGEMGYLTEETQTLEHVLIRGNDGGEIQIKNIADPTDLQDAVTKKYSDAMDEENKAYADQLWKEYEGSYSGEMKYWDGDKWEGIPVGNNGNILTLVKGVPTWITNSATFKCGEDITFPYNGSVVTYGTINKNGLCWMDRNLGSSRVPVVSDDELGFGDYFQWGRGDDGHQISSSQSIDGPINYDSPGHAFFITNQSSPWDWRIPQNNDLWKGTMGTNNPCPAGWRVPTSGELNAELSSWIPQNATGAFASILRWPASNSRDPSGGHINYNEARGLAYSSSTTTVWAINLLYDSETAKMNHISRGYGLSVRCVRE